MEQEEKRQQFAESLASQFGAFQLPRDEQKNESTADATADQQSEKADEEKTQAKKKNKKKKAAAGGTEAPRSSIVTRMKAA